MSIVRRNPKHALVESFLQRGSVYLHIDARLPDVQCPRHLVGKVDLVFQVGYALSTPIPDLLVNEYGVSGTLSFRGKSHFCFVPWVAIYGVADETGKGQFFGEVPEAVREKQKAAVETKSWTQGPGAPAGKVIRVDFKKKRRVG